VAPRSETTARIDAFAARLSYALRVPGTHPSGLSYDALIAILAAQGRDFTADSERARDHVRIVLREQFAGSTRPPGLAQLKQFAAAALLEWMLARIESGLRDVPIKPNDPVYRAWKRKHAAYSVPLMHTGALRNRVRDHGRVEVKT